MDNKENHLLFERYLTTTRHNINEGLIDRVKSRAAGVVGAVKGAGQQIAGQTKGMVAGGRGNIQGVQDAQQQVKAGKSAGAVSKVKSYKQTALKKFDKVTNEVFTDLKKLGIKTKGVSPASMNKFKKSLEASFDRLITELQK